MATAQKLEKMPNKFNIKFVLRNKLFTVGQGLLIIEVLRSHSIIYTTLGRTPLDERSARRRDPYLTTHNIHKRQTFMTPAGFEPTIPESEWPKTHALEGVVPGITFQEYIKIIIIIVIITIYL
jgi:hypothetical protein